jgi:non-heme Fe2+,alpha-ketoglutarate-dependent halogenase
MNVDRKVESVAKCLADMYELTTDQVQAFRRDGFLGPLPAFLPGSELDQICREAMDMNEHQRDQPLYDQFVLRDLHLCMPGMNRLFTHPAVYTAVQALLGEDSLLLWRSFLFPKKAGVGELGWHQEWGYFDGEEIGGSIPALQPSERYKSGEKAGLSWDLTVWFALTDVTPEQGPVRFARGSHNTRYPTKLVPMTECEFFHQIAADLFKIDDAQEIVRRTKANRLLLETVNTSSFFDGVDTASLTAQAAREIVVNRMSKLEAVVTLPFEIAAGDSIEVPMKKGEFVIFYERTMHGSAANNSASDRIGVNCRITAADTLVYPQRLVGSFIDGSGLDISRHWNVPLCGSARHPANIYSPPAAAAAGRG